MVKRNIKLHQKFMFWPWPSLHLTNKTESEKLIWKIMYQMLPRKLYHHLYDKFAGMFFNTHILHTYLHINILLAYITIHENMKYFTFSMTSRSRRIYFTIWWYVQSLLAWQTFCSKSIAAFFRNGKYTQRICRKVKKYSNASHLIDN